MQSLEFSISLHDKQLEIFEHPGRFKIVACGRRFGKTTLAAYMVVLHALETPNARAWIISPTFSQSQIMWEMVKHILQNKALKKYVREIKIGEKYVELINGARIHSKSGDNPDSLRGEGLTYVVIDEAAMVKQEVWYEAVRPALADKAGHAMFISTPKGKNWFYKLFLRGQEEKEGYVSFRYTSYSNPFLQAKELDEMAKEMPELIYQQEILADFIAAGGAVFKNLDRVLYNPSVIFKEGAEKDRVYVAGLDVAKYEDFTVMCVFDFETREQVAYYRWNRVDWGYQKIRIHSIAKQWNDCIVNIDSTGVGDPIAEELARMGVNISYGGKGFKFTAISKRQAIELLQTSIDNALIKIANIPEIVQELEAYEYEMLEHSGNIRYGAPKGDHDDIVISLALAVDMLKHSFGGLGIGCFDQVEVEPDLTLEDYITDYEETDEDTFDWEEF